MHYLGQNTPIFIPCNVPENGFFPGLPFIQKKCFLSALSPALPGKVPWPIGLEFGSVRFRCYLKSYKIFCNEYKSTDQMRTNLGQVLLSGRNDGHLFEPEYTEEETLQWRKQQSNVQQHVQTCCGSHSSNKVPLHGQILLWLCFY